MVTPKPGIWLLPWREDGVFGGRHSCIRASDRAGNKKHIGEGPRKSGSVVITGNSEGILNSHVRLLDSVGDVNADKYELALEVTG